jgi:predicted dehydrogenase
MTDMGTHHMETIQWFMGAEAPLSAVAAGGKLMEREPFETPDTLRALWEYPGWTLEFGIREASGYNRERSLFGILFHGTGGTLYIDRAGFEITPDRGKAPAMVVGTPRDPNYMPETLSRRHIQNFLTCMRTRELPRADVEIGHRATTVCHLGNIAYRTGRKIRWDSRREQILDDAEAGKLLVRDYRAPYLLPEL